MVAIIWSLYWNSARVVGSGLSPFWPLYMAAWAALQHNIWILKGTFQEKGCQEGESRNFQAKQGLVPEQTQCHFHYIRLVKIATDSAQSLRRGDYTRCDSLGVVQKHLPHLCCRFFITSKTIPCLMYTLKLNIYLLNTFNITCTKSFFFFLGECSFIPLHRVSQLSRTNA